MSLLMQFLAKGCTFGRLKRRSTPYKVTGSEGCIPVFQDQSPRDTCGGFAAASSCQLNLDEAPAAENCKLENRPELFSLERNAEWIPEKQEQRKDSPWFWFEEEPNPFLAETPVQCSSRWRQGELGLTNLQVKRNDLTDSDLELVAVRAVPQPKPAPERAVLGAGTSEAVPGPWSALAGWQNLAARLMRVGRSVLS